MSEHETLYIGVMGFSDKNFDREKAQKHLEQAFNFANAIAAPEVEIVIVSGLTYLGIPAIAYDIANEYGWNTVGIACAKANSGKYPLYPCDETQIVGEEWGDESQTFIDKCDIFVRVGGGEQTFRETAAAIVTGKVVLEFDLEKLSD